MQLLKSTVAFAALLSGTEAVNLLLYLGSSANNCNGNLFVCRNIGPSTCCDDPNQTSHRSAAIENVPSNRNTEIRTYASGGCTASPSPAQDGTISGTKRELVDDVPCTSSQRPDAIRFEDGSEISIGDLDDEQASLANNDGTQSEITELVTSIAA
ncbi:hypothetical protein Micbo1qcDRAFT_207672 [Microdochium bolleyi]|uniref:Uncharacterized protein n=1 Tax=Microdochium bolleyi TaxID=196109 RepID=A0A136ISM4_9PEZI|nr:hypothetical protein Micbo1qcDRAFT_207672 [Microdochium bolleyi]